MPRIILVGSQPGTVTNQLTSHLKKQGYDYIVLADKRLVPEMPQDSRWIACTFSSRERIIQAIDSIALPVDAVMTLYENYVLPCAWIAEHRRLPGMSEASALLCTDKFLMRQAFAAAPEPISPDFALVETEDDVRAFAATHQFPLILKPANLVKSLLVSKSDSLEQLIANYRHTATLIHDTYRQYAPDRTPTMLIEEFLQGSMHSVAAFADSAGEPHTVDKIVDLQLARDIGFDDNFIYARSVPSHLSQEEQASLLHCAHLGIRALGMQSSPAHVEIILTAQGPRIVEIGARNGGYRERMYRLAYGVDLLAAAVDVACGKQPMLAATKDESCAVLELFPKTPGVFVGIQGAEEIQALPSCAYFSVKATAGQHIGTAAGGFKRTAIVILHHPDKQQIDTDLRTVRRIGAVHVAAY